MIGSGEFPFMISRDLSAFGVLLNLSFPCFSTPVLGISYPILFLLLLFSNIFNKKVKFHAVFGLGTLMYLVGVECSHSHVFKTKMFALNCL